MGKRDLINVYVNGTYLGQRVTGQQRYASEIQERIASLTNEFGISFGLVGVSKNQGNSLSQWAKALMLGYKVGSNSWLISLTSRAPILARNHVIVVHDLFVLTNKSWFSKKYWVTHGLILKAQLRFAKIAVCVSEPTAEILKASNLTKAKIVVAPNAPSDVFNRYQAEPSFENIVLAARGVSRKSFFLSVGAADPRKNIATLIEAHKSLSDSTRKQYPLVLVGPKSKVFSSEELKIDTWITWLDDVDDKELAVLYANCLSFVMPSFAEGFGLPIVEALAVGADVIANDIEVFHWVGGDSIEYVDCNNGAELLAIKIKEKVTLGQRTVKKSDQRFSWDSSARTILEAILDSKRSPKVQKKDRSARLNIKEPKI